MLARFTWLPRLFAPFQQVPSGTNQFFDWYFNGLNGLGGWFIFLLLALAAALWLFYDSQKRRLPALGWRMGVILLAALLLPTILYRASVRPEDFEIYQILKAYDPQCPDAVIKGTYPWVNFTSCDELRRSLPPLTPFGEYVFYLGLLGGILAPALAVGYFVTFQGLAACPQRHLYEAVLGECPQCARQRGYQAASPVPVKHASRAAAPEVVPVKPARTPQPEAWIVDMSNNRRFNLFAGVNKIGRSPDCDILLDDPAVSRPHAQLREANGYYTLSDLGSQSGTRLNGNKLLKPQVLQNGDEIEVGDTVLSFVTGRQN